VGANLETLPSLDPVEAIRRRTSTGTSGNLRLDVPRAAAVQLASTLQARHEHIAMRVKALAGRDVAFFRDPLR